MNIDKSVVLRIKEFFISRSLNCLCDDLEAFIEKNFVKTCEFKSSKGKYAGVSCNLGLHNNSEFCKKHLSLRKKTDFKKSMIDYSKNDLFQDIEIIEMTKNGIAFLVGKDNNFIYKKRKNGYTIHSEIKN